MDHANLGLILIKDFISDKEELEIINNLPTSKIQKTISKRRNGIYRYGSSSPYEDMVISNDIPTYLDKISQKIYNNRLLDKKPNSVSINEYLPGNTIFPHIDSLSSGPVISVVSLLSDAKMVLEKDNESFSIVLPRKSLVQLRDEIRYKWKHSVPPVINKRYSIVFRYGE